MTRSTIIKRTLILLLALSSVLLQAGMRGPSAAAAVATGAWGGEHIILVVSEKGADVEFDCAHGKVAHRITLNKHGDFDVGGTFTPEHGGPVLRDENTQSAPARYSGHVDGGAMSLTVILAKEKVGIFTLTRGSYPNLRKCR